MDRSDIFQIVVDIVNDQGPLKGTELVSEAVDVFFRNNYTEKLEKVDFVEIISQCVERKMIIEVEYIVPRMNYRTKSLYFPVGSIINGLRHAG